MIVGVVPLLVVAGLFEGLFSPAHVPAALKFLVGAVLFSLLTLWLLRPATAAVAGYTRTVCLRLATAQRSARPRKPRRHRNTSPVSASPRSDGVMV